MNSTLDKYQAIVITGFTGITMCDFSAFHADVESRMGRPVWSHEFGFAPFVEELKEMYKYEFLALCNTEKA